ncbi:hypothetical protein [Thiomonas sp.]|jgi:hypothetical protein|uniref:hypothetical protein n=1 Tax=Thiomonas sp. TaxID=2047785 RepID=UPI0025858765|nr:hypothetical protein [Thiomonas sp.]
MLKISEVQIHADRAAGAEQKEQADALARRLLAAIAPLSPAVAAQTRDPSAARVWLDSWARQIAAADLSAAELAAGLSRLHQIPPSQPLGWQQFYSCCRPRDEGITANDLEARCRNLPALPDPAAVQRRIDAARRALTDPRIAKFLHRVSPDAE